MALDFKSDKKLRKIPILISKYNDGGVNGWRAEIADCYNEYKPMMAKDINFEDLTFHFHHSVDTHEWDDLVFETRRNAVKCAKYVNETYLKGKAKIWF